MVRLRRSWLVPPLFSRLACHESGELFAGSIGERFEKHHSTEWNPSGHAVADTNRRALTRTSQPPKWQIESRDLF
jgi:hypothetical protein